MDHILPLIISSILFLGPVFYLLFFGSDIFGLPRYTVILYIIGLVLGFTVWKPMVLITLGLTWGLIIISWGMIFWGILRQK